MAVKDDKPKRSALLDDICRRLKSQIEGLEMLEDEAAEVLARAKEDRLKRKLLLEMLKRQLDELDR